jgi:chromate transporter
VLAKSATDGEHADLGARVTRSWAVAALITYFPLLIGLPVVAALIPDQSLALIDSFYRLGSLVFGGGHVVLPLLRSEVVPPGWLVVGLCAAGGAGLAML